MDDLEVSYESTVSLKVKGLRFVVSGNEETHCGALLHDGRCNSGDWFELPATKTPHQGRESDGHVIILIIAASKVEFTPSASREC
jgi:hypothetical protein